MMSHFAFFVNTTLKQTSFEPQTARQRLKDCAIRALVVLILVPGILAAIGAIVDKATFGDYNPNFHVRYLAFSGWVASPFVLLRWSYSGGKYLTVLRLAIYLLQTTGIIVAYTRAVVSGAEPYHAVEHIRTFFSAEGQFESIRSQEDVYRWLENVMTRVYGPKLTQGPGNGRTVAGRWAMLLPVRIRQNRVRPTECPALIRNQNLRGFDRCYLRFSSGNEDRSPFTAMNFSWTSLPYETFTGSMDMGDVYVHTKLNSYPIAGYWIFVNPYTPVRLALDQIRMMKRVGWIDKATRLIAVDVVLSAPELAEPVWGLIEFTIEISQTGQYIPNTPRLIFNHLETFDYAQSESNVATFTRLYTHMAGVALDPDEREQQGITTQGNAVTRCGGYVGKQYYVPFYLGIFSSAVYTLLELFIIFRQDWRKSLKRIFTYTEALWIILLITCVSLRYSSDRALPCVTSVVTQDPFSAANTTKEVFDTAVVYRFELHVASIGWQAAREILGLAMFIHVFNSLKFIVNFASLGVLIRTMQAAGPELASFSSLVCHRLLGLHDHVLHNLQYASQRV